MLTNIHTYRVRDRHRALTGGVVVMIGLSVLLTAGCQTAKPKASETREVKQAPMPAAKPAVRWSSHTLQPNDVVVLMLTVPRCKPTGPYRLQPGDRIEIEGVRVTERAIAATVAPDGKISLPLVGDVTAAGKTVRELADALDLLYARYVRSPRIVVSPQVVGADAQELRRAFGGDGRQGLEVAVGPGGTINLPRLGAVRAGGRTVDELAEMLTSRYRRIVPGAQVTVTIRTLAPRQAYVLGMVARPGPVNLREAGTLLRALAQVGGWTLASNLKQVVVFSRAAQMGANAEPIVVDIERLARGRRGGWTDVQLAPGDVVVVPKTTISDFNDFVDQVFVRGVYGILPFTPDIIFYSR